MTPSTASAPVPSRRAADAVARLDTAQKAALTTGASFWHTADLPAAGLPSVMVTDGPHGLRKQVEGGDHLGLLDGVAATCFPPAVTLASTWDAALVQRVGDAIGAEALAEQVAVVLGPGVNIKRSVRCGRNFEYFSEDPFLAGRLGAAWVRGVQARGVGASLKHFAANNQETDRLRISAEVDERTLHEIYLRAFRHVVTTEQPWTVMCAYNALNGVFAAENRWLLTEVLREEWGFEGLVVSDWGAVHDRAAALAAGLDLEMPGTGGRTAAEVVAAVAAGSLAEGDLDLAAQRVADVVLRAGDTARATAAARPDLDALHETHHELAREAAAAGVVLLTNDGVLPLTAGQGRVAVVGELARTPRYQGAGSSQITPTRLDDALSALTGRLGADAVRFAPGYRLDGDADDALGDDALAAAEGADVVVVFCGLPPQDESEGYDREHIELPDVQTALLERLLAVHDRVVVVLSHGSVVRVSGWAGRAAAVVEGWLGGQGGGEGTARVLLGEVNPSGRLAETVPVRLEDTPDYLDFPGEQRTVRYGEGLFVGYRWYDGRDLPVAFPFGHGLSYTTFGYADATARLVGDVVRVEVDVTNEGDRDGRETVQVYAGLPGSSVRRPVRELCGFAQVDVPAGATVRARVDVPLDELRYWSVGARGWRLEGGTYRFAVGASSRDVRAALDVSVAGDGPVFPLTVDSTVGEWLADPVVGTMTRERAVAFGLDPESPAFEMAKQMPMRGVVGFAPGLVDLAELEEAAAAARAATA
ncbi:glycoside hydrolase family 3 C-terminal domain-containing protein [Isoptericola cucumis]|uniref:glycoside hydrolase family 3 C-terminal domain-containing protein n=1 Tax=Isoptericola cucumis TaxID=1776856 RepID=UPI003207BA67